MTLIIIESTGNSIEQTVNNKRLRNSEELKIKAVGNAEVVKQQKIQELLEIV